MNDNVMKLPSRELDDLIFLLFIKFFQQAFMMIKELSHTNAILSMVASFLERWNISTYQRESIQVFYLLLKVWNFLTLGQVLTIIFVLHILRYMYCLYLALIN